MIMSYYAKVTVAIYSINRSDVRVNNLWNL